MGLYMGESLVRSVGGGGNRCVCVGACVCVCVCACVCVCVCVFVCAAAYRHVVMWVSLYVLHTVLRLIIEMYLSCAFATHPTIT